VQQGQLGRTHLDAEVGQQVTRLGQRQGEVVIAQLAQLAAQP